MVFKPHLYMLSRMTLASSRLVFKPHLYMLSRMTLASSRLVFKPHLYMLSRMTLASSRLVFKPHLYMISRMTLASSTFYPSLRGGGGGTGRHLHLGPVARAWLGVLLTYLGLPQHAYTFHSLRRGACHLASDRGPLSQTYRP